MKDLSRRYSTIGAATTFSGTSARRKLIVPEAQIARSYRRHDTGSVAALNVRCAIDKVPMSELGTLDYYASHSALSDPRAHARLIGGLPPDIAALCGILQGLLIHEAWIERQGFDTAVQLAHGARSASSVG